MISEDDSLSFATCVDYVDVMSIKLRLTDAVDDDPRSFEESVVSFAGPAFDFSKGESIQLPFVADGWTADVEYVELTDWSHASLSLVTEGGGGTSTGTFSRTDLQIGEWTQLGQDSDSCTAPR